jgi:hypothetical protein
MPSILHISWKNVDINARPWSVINFEPVPCLVTIWLAQTLAHVSALWSLIGVALA